MPFPFEYRIERNARRKRLAVTVTAAGEVIVKAPVRASKREIERLLGDSSEWILGALARAESRREAVGVSEETDFLPGETLPLFGRECPILFSDTGAPYFRAGVFYLTGEDREIRKHEVEKLYIAIAKEVLPKTVARLANLVGLIPAGVKIGRAARSWGYCKKDGTLYFSWRLIAHDERVVEYVVVHELCHLQHFDHSQAFWSAVGQVIPDYKAVEKSDRAKALNLRLTLMGLMPG